VIVKRPISAGAEYHAKLLLFQTLLFIPGTGRPGAIGLENGKIKKSLAKAQRRKETQERSLADRSA
jgi:hypothetical protein